MKRAMVLEARMTPVPIDPSLTSALVSEAGVQTYIGTAMLTLVAYNAGARYYETIPLWV